uniref:Putative nucleotidyltransferase, ribonuclease H n=1 Tax=Tanacetum cinerariifolium TaxID=118510 RepID=A0A699U2E4_TANCI|nr:putative nucleotidyltransferase, ribonuclease H [Tanacetum cinerariifolium]
MIEVTNKKVSVAKEKLKEARTRQKSYADKHRRSRIKGVKGSVTGIVRARLYSSKCVTMGCISFICQEEGW